MSFSFHHIIHNFFLNTTLNTMSWPQEVFVFSMEANLLNANQYSVSISMFRNHDGDATKTFPQVSVADEPTKCIDVAQNIFCALLYTPIYIYISICIFVQFINKLSWIFRIVTLTRLLKRPFPVMNTNQFVTGSWNSNVLMINASRFGIHNPSTV